MIPAENDFPGFDAQTLASQGNAILGIRDSGKSYTGVLMAERFYDAGIPFVAFDPIGRWRFLRTPGPGKGYPVVVAGGAAGDLPLKPTTAAAIVRAAMESGVSLVIDLYDMEISKSDWRKIVAESVRVLLYSNGAHGLRHIFIEEAAEFCPQRVGPDQGRVYAEIEKLARMGGNARLGYTLINQRAEEVNKAVLELCDNLFLHRQKGKNSLNSLSKWLDVADVRTGKEIVASLPTLPQGECWAWMAGTDRPVHVRVPRKNSFEPDRRAMGRQDGAAAAKTVNVAEFVTSMRVFISSASNEEGKMDTGKESRPSGMVEKINRTPPIDIEAIRKAAYEEGYRAGRFQGFTDGWKELQVSFISQALGSVDAMAKDVRGLLSHEPYDGQIREYAARVGAATAPPITPPKASVARETPSQSKPVTQNANSGIDRPLQRIIDAIRYWNVFGISEPTHHQVAFIANYAPGSGTWSRYLSALRSEGLIEARGPLKLTALGEAAAADPAEQPSGERLRASVLQKLDAPLARIFTPILNAYPKSLSHSIAGEKSGYEPGSGTWSRYLSSLRSLDLIERRGELKAQEWLFP